MSTDEGQAIEEAELRLLKDQAARMNARIFKITRTHDDIMRDVDKDRALWAALNQRKAMYLQQADNTALLQLTRQPLLKGDGKNLHLLLEVANDNSETTEAYQQHQALRLLRAKGSDLKEALSIDSKLPSEQQILSTIKQTMETFESDPQASAELLVEEALSKARRNLIRRFDVQGAAALQAISMERTTRWTSRPSIVEEVVGVMPTLSSAADFAARAVCAATEALALQERPNPLLGLNRTPVENGLDAITSSSDSKHVVLLRNGYMAAVTVITPEGKLYDPFTIAERIAKTRVLASKSANPQAVSLITSTWGVEPEAEHQIEKVDWMEARSLIRSSPREAATLSVLESALFVVCLDEASNEESLPEEADADVWATRVPFVNRWFMSGINVIANSSTGQISMMSTMVDCCAAAAAIGEARVNFAICRERYVPSLLDNSVMAVALVFRHLMTSLAGRETSRLTFDELEMECAKLRRITSDNEQATALDSVGLLNLPNAPLELQMEFLERAQVFSTRESAYDGDGKRVFYLANPLRAAEDAVEINMDLSFFFEPILSLAAKGFKKMHYVYERRFSANDSYGKDFRFSSLNVDIEGLPTNTTARSIATLAINATLLHVLYDCEGEGLLRTLPVHVDVNTGSAFNFFDAKLVTTSAARELYETFFMPRMLQRPVAMTKARAAEIVKAALLEEGSTPLSWSQISSTMMVEAASVVENNITVAALEGTTKPIGFLSQPLGSPAAWVSSYFGDDEEAAGATRAFGHASVCYCSAASGVDRITLHGRFKYETQCRAFCRYFRHFCDELVALL